MLPLLTDSAPASDAGLRERKKQLARDAIVDAALELFAENGYDATTVPAIAERASVSPATVARYFPSKESLLFTERDVRSATLRTAIVARPRRESPLHAVLGALTDQSPMTHTARDRLLRTRVAIARSSVLRGRALGLLDEWRDGIAEGLAARDGIDPDLARVLATAVVAVLDDVTVRWAADGGSGDLQAMVRRAIEMLNASARKPR